MTTRIPARSECGFSILELMVAMTIALFLIGGAMEILVSNKQAASLISDSLDIQDSARFATRRIGNLMRMAGHRGGVELSKVKTDLSSLSGSGTGVCEQAWLVERFTDEPIRGYPGGTGIVDVGACATAGLTAANHVANTDVLVIRHSEALHEADPGSSANQGRLFIYAIVSERASLGLGSDIATSWDAFSGQPEKVYGRYIYPYYTDVYYVRPWSNSATESPKVPALVRLRMDGATSTTELMVSGVEFMRSEFGISSVNDDQVDQYKSPAKITSSADWPRVRLARLAIVARSLGRDPQIKDTKQYVMLAGDNEYTFDPSGAAEQYARMMFEISIHLRNTVDLRAAN